jgi:hypothetical protein
MYGGRFEGAIGKSRRPVGSKNYWLRKDMVRSISKVAFVKLYLRDIKANHIQTVMGMARFPGDSLGSIVRFPNTIHRTRRRLSRSPQRWAYNLGNLGGSI